jgi:phosphoglycolate phosphatase-like HAD superfamily hydrolase
MVGDSTRDILAGKKSGLTTILVKTGYAGSDGTYPVRPDYEVRDLKSAAGVIKRHAA